jgi:hypothetical protein
MDAFVRRYIHDNLTYNQLGIASDLGAELTALDATCQLSLGGDDRPHRGRVVAIQDARVAAETKGADFG